MKEQSTTGGSFESLQSVKNLERLSKKQRNNQSTDQSGTVDFFFPQQPFIGEARLTLARKIAAITLTLWKKGEDFDINKLNSQAA